eukprot:3038201-Prorocentrum_lima.AAC.1
MVIVAIIQLKGKAEAADRLFFPGDLARTEAVKQKDVRVLKTTARTFSQDPRGLARMRSKGLSMG